MHQLNNYLFGKKTNKQECLTPYSFILSIDDLMVWDGKDYNTPFNRVDTPLKKRIISKENKPKIVGIFNQQSLQESQGSNEFNVFNFDYWQYIDIFVYSINSTDKNIIVPPSCYIRTGHNNGVKIYGTIHFLSVADGGNFNRVMQFLQKSINNVFPGADQLIKLAKICGFDGWFIDQETEGCNSQISTIIQEFCGYIQEKSSVEIMWRDSMIIDGTIDCQNELDSLNSCFFESDSNGQLKKVSTNLFLNYDWSIKSLENSKICAQNLKRNEYDIYAGINVTGFNYINFIKQAYDKNNEFSTSIGLFNADWPYSKSKSYEEFYKNQLNFWNLLNPYIELNSSVTTLPFVTNFNTGQGKKYFVNGSIVSDKNWNDISQQDIMPTWRDHIITKEHSYVNTDMCYDDAYIGGSCIRFDGLIKPKTYIDVDMYKTLLEIKTGTKMLHIFTKRIVNFIKASIIIHFVNNKYVNLTLSDDILYNVWAINKFKMIFDDNTIDKISIRFENVNENEEMAFTLLLGGISIFMETSTLPKNPQKLKITNLQKIECDQDFHKHYVKDQLSFNLTWNKDNTIWYYCIFRCIVSEKSNSVEFIGRTSNNIYHIEKLTRKEDELYSLISIKSVSYDQTVCVEESVIKI